MGRYAALILGFLSRTMALMLFSVTKCCIVPSPSQNSTYFGIVLFSDPTKLKIIPHTIKFKSLHNTHSDIYLKKGKFLFCPDNRKTAFHQLKILAHSAQQGPNSDQSTTRYSLPSTHYLNCPRCQNVSEGVVLSLFHSFHNVLLPVSLLLQIENWQASSSFLLEWKCLVNISSFSEICSLPPTCVRSMFELWSRAARAPRQNMELWL